MSMMWNAVALDAAELRQVLEATEPFSALRALPAERWSGLDKAWDAAHWLLTGGAEPVDGADGFIKSGGEVLDALDAGYGPARFLDAPSVAATRALLSGLSRERLAARWDAEAMVADDVYPFAVSGRASADDLDFVFDHLQAFIGFLERIDVAQKGLLVFLD